MSAAGGLRGTIFSHHGFYAVAAERDGRVVGSNAVDERSVIDGIGSRGAADDVLSEAPERRPT